MDAKLKRLINKRAKEVKIDISQGEEIWESLGKFVKSVIREGKMEDLDSYKSIYIKDLGTLYPNKKFIYKRNAVKQEFLANQKDEDI